MAFTRQQLPNLPYDYSALEPIISGKIMELHHNKHHKGYVDNLNAALEKEAQAEQKGGPGLEDLSTKIALQSAIQFNGGGHINHSIFWTNLLPPKEFAPPKGELLDALTRDFGSLQQFIDTMSAQTLAIQGSGWGWLGVRPGKKRLEIATCPNQTPLSTTGLIPLLGIDVWEHAYYLLYENRRGDYLKKIWEIINWKNVADRYQAALKSS